MSQSLTKPHVRRAGVTMSKSLTKPHVRRAGVTMSQSLTEPHDTVATAMVGTGGLNGILNYCKYLVACCCEEATTNDAKSYLLNKTASKVPDKAEHPFMLLS